MTYDAYNSSRAAGGPVQLFRFVYGTEAAEYYAYTSHSETLTVDHGAPVGSIEYEPIPIERGNIVSNGTLDKSSIQITLDIGTGLAELFRVYPPSQVVLLYIYEGHIDDGDEEFQLVWAGRVMGAKREGSELRLSGEPIATQMKRTGLRRHYQYGCPHVVYGADIGLGPCIADKAAATVTATVMDIDGTVVGLSAAWEGALPRSKFVRGQLEWTPAGGSVERRTIIRIANPLDDLTLSGIPNGLEVGDTVSVILGCNHRAFDADGGDCEGLHNALVSFGGQPYIPTKNVILSNPYY